MSSGWVFQDRAAVVPYWWSRLLQDNNYACRLVRRWQNLRSSVWNESVILVQPPHVKILTLQQRVDSISTLLNDVLPREFWRFPDYDPKAWNYAQEINYFKQFIVDRGTWLDANLNSFVTATCQFSSTTVFPTEIRTLSPEFLEMKNTGNANVDLNG